MIQIDWNKPVHVVNWVTQETLLVVPVSTGLKIMADSQRFDAGKCTDRVRTIDGETPVVFQQEPTERDGEIDSMIEEFMTIKNVISKAA